MRKLVLFSIAALVFLCAAASYGALSYAPRLAHKKLQENLNTLGFQGIALQKPEVRFGVIRYQNASLDAEKFSTINTAYLRYRPFSLLFFGIIDSIEIDGLNITGDISPAPHHALSVAGWTRPRHRALKREIRNAFRIKRLEISNARLSVMTPQWGGVNIEFNMHAINDGKSIEIYSTSQSRQRNIGFESTGRGQIYANGYWQKHFEFEQGKLEQDELKLNRLSGQLTLEGGPDKTTEILSEFSAGGLLLYGFPWHNASGTLSGTPDEYAIYADAKSPGSDHIELSLTYRSDLDGRNLLASLHAQTLGHLLGYLQSQNLMPPDDTIFAPWKNAENIRLDLQVNLNDPDLRNDLTFNLSNNNQLIDIAGNIIIKDRDSYSAGFSSLPLSLQNIDASSFNSGNLIINGAFERDGQNFTGNIALQLDKASYIAGGFPVENLDGTLALNDLTKLTTQKPDRFKCTLPLNITHTCTLNAEINNGSPNFKNLDVRLLGGAITLDNFNPLQEGGQWTLRGRSLDLAALGKALGWPGFSAEGNISFDIPIIRRDEQLLVRDGVISSQNKGTLRYTNAQPPAFLRGSEAEQQTLKNLLNDYRYESFEIKLNGPLLGTINMAINTRGYNTAVFQNRAINLNLGASSSISGLLSPLYSPPDHPTKQDEN